MTNLLTFGRDGHGSPTDDDMAFGEHAILAILKDAGQGGASPDRVLGKLIAQILVVTDSQAVRNAAALALVDLEARDQTDALIRVIGRPELSQHSGTLLFALDELGGVLPLDTLVHLLEHLSYEAKAEALILVRQGRIGRPADPEREAELLRNLAALAASGNEDVAESAGVALDHLVAA